MATPPLTLRLMTPTGLSRTVACDSVLLRLRDGADGRGGGFVGIQRGHAPAVMALAEGQLSASLEQKPVFRAALSGGFASVSGDTVTVITDSAEVQEEPNEPFS